MYRGLGELNEKEGHWKVTGAPSQAVQATLLGDESSPWQVSSARNSDSFRCNVCVEVNKRNCDLVFWA